MIWAEHSEHKHKASHKDGFSFANADKIKLHISAGWPVTKPTLEMLKSL